MHPREGELIAGGPRADGEQPFEGGARRSALLVLLALTVLTLISYLPVLQNGFVAFDDPQYVYENPHVRAGITQEALGWALTASVAGHWHPLTMLSHMTDVQLFGLNPKGHHLTSLILHLANVLLLFVVLRRMTGALWRSAAVAALLAVHPVHVESVAWIADRKDVLCGLFWLLAILGYLNYVRAPGFGRYLLVAAALAASLSAKAMAVSLPLVLLLLDYWPLGRFARAAWLVAESPPGGAPRPRFAAPSTARLVGEKIPLLLIAALSAWVALRTQAAPMSSGNDAPLALRLGNTATSYFAYLGKMLDPVHLGVFYAFQPVPALRVLAAALALAAVTGLAVLLRRRAPFVLVGWLWYLITLLPVIGILQVGWQAMADRYTYLPSIGISIAFVWGLAALLERLQAPRFARRAVAVLVAALLAVMVGMTRSQVATWADTLTLFEHAVEVAPSYLAHTNVAEELRARGDMAGALAHYRAAAALAPRNPQAHAALGSALRAAGRPAEALPPLRTALGLDPHDERARLTLAMALDDLGQSAAAINELRQVLVQHPGSLDAQRGLAALLQQRSLRPANPPG